MQILRNFIFSSNYSRKYEQASAIDYSDVQIQPIHPASTIPTPPHGKVLLAADNATVEAESTGLRSNHRSSGFALSVMNSDELINWTVLP